MISTPILFTFNKMDGLDSVEFNRESFNEYSNKWEPMGARTVKVKGYMHNIHHLSHGPCALSVDFLDDFRALQGGEKEKIAANYAEKMERIRKEDRENAYDPSADARAVAVKNNKRLYGMTKKQTEMVGTDLSGYWTPNVAHGKPPPIFKVTKVFKSTSNKLMVRLAALTAALYGKWVEIVGGMNINVDAQGMNVRRRSAIESSLISNPIQNERVHCGRMLYV